MDINTIIIILIVAIVVCISILLFFVIADNVKKKKTIKSESVLADTQNTVKASDVADKEEVKDVKPDSSITVETSVKAENVEKASGIDPNGVTEVLASTMEEFSVQENNTAYDEESSVEIKSDISVISENVAKNEETTSKQPLNPLPIRKPVVTKETEATAGNAEEPAKDKKKISVENEIGFLEGEDVRDSVMKLLQSIATELSKRATNEEKACINYLDDNALDIQMQDGYFLLNNEEIMRNGLIQDGDIVNVYAGDRIIIRFCVNFAVPSGYDVQVISNVNALKARGLVVKEIICPKASSLSIRAILQAERSCKISKRDNLFKVHILQEVVL